MSVIRYEQERSFKDAQKAFDYMLGAEHKTIFFYDSDRKRLQKIAEEFFELVHNHNSKITDINKQLITTNGYPFDDIDGCLAVHCLEIGVHNVEDTLGCVALFSGYNKNVLVDTEQAKVADLPIGVPGVKAMTSIAMLGSMLYN